MSAIRKDSVDDNLLSYRYLPSLFAELRKEDPEGTYFLDATETTYDVPVSLDESKSAKMAREKSTPTKLMFRRYLVIPSAAKSVWANSRKVATADGARLTSVLGGTILTLNCFLATDNPIPAVLACVDCENGENWIWFLKHAFKNLGQPKLLITDRFSGLKALNTFVKNEAEMRTPPSIERETHSTNRTSSTTVTQCTCEVCKTLLQKREEHASKEDIAFKNSFTAQFKVVQRQAIDTLFNDNDRIGWEIRFNSMTHKSMNRLISPNTWLNDEVVNLYFEILRDRANALHKLKPLTKKTIFVWSYFYTKMKSSADYEGGGKYLPQSMSRESKKWSDSVSDIGTIFIPININNFHWTLVKICLDTRDIEYLDGFQDYHRKCKEVTDLIIQWAEEYIKNTPYDTKKRWRVRVSSRVPSQPHTSSDCGLYCIMTAEYLAEGLPLSFQQKDMDDIRIKVAGIINRGKLDYAVEVCNNAGEVMVDDDFSGGGASPTTLELSVQSNDKDDETNNRRQCIVYTFCALHLAKNAGLASSDYYKVIELAKLYSKKEQEDYISQNLDSCGKEACNYIKTHLDDVSYVGMKSRGLICCHNTVTSNASEQGNWSLKKMRDIDISKGLLTYLEWLSSKLEDHVMLVDKWNSQAQFRTVCRTAVQKTWESSEVEGRYSAKIESISRGATENITFQMSRANEAQACWVVSCSTIGEEVWDRVKCGRCNTTEIKGIACKHASWCLRRIYNMIQKYAKTHKLQADWVNSGWWEPYELDKSSWYHDSVLVSTLELQVKDKFVVVPTIEADNACQLWPPDFRRTLGSTQSGRQRQRSENRPHVGTSAVRGLRGTRGGKSKKKKRTTTTTTRTTTPSTSSFPSPTPVRTTSSGISAFLM